MYQCIKCGRSQGFLWSSPNCAMGGSCIVRKVQQRIKVVISAKALQVLIVMILIAGHASAQRLVTTYYDWNKIHPYKQYYVNAAGQNNGLYKEYSPAGVVVKEYTYLNGLENGLCTDYAAVEGNKRVIAARCSFKNGKPDGYYVQFWGYDGYQTKVQEGYYKLGKKTGVWREWWCNEDKPNCIKSKATYTNDALNGPWTLYHDIDTGKSVSEGQYHNGTRVGSWILLFDNYNREVKEASTARTSIQVNLDSMGNPKGKGIIHDLRNPGGRIEGEIVSIDPTMEWAGHVTWFSGSGKKIQEVDFVNGMREGELLAYNADEKVILKEHYSKDRKVAADECFSPEGQPIKCN